MKTLNIIGPGRVGCVLGRALQKAAVCDILGVYGRSLARSQAACDFIGAGSAVPSLATLPEAQLTLFTVPDEAIASVSEAWAAEVGQLSSVVCHCSGALPASVLQVPAGIVRASWHPPMTFAAAGLSEINLQDIVCVLEGDAAAMPVLQRLCQGVGSASVVLKPGADKLLYHASLVIVSNYLVTLTHLGQLCLAEAGIAEEARALGILLPLMKQVMANLERGSIRGALTGPVERGDWNIVQAEAASLEKWQPALATLYRQLADMTHQLAQVTLNH